MAQVVLSQEDFEEVQKTILEAFENQDALSDWERAFVEDNVKRLEKYGARTLFSDKQLAAIDRIRKALDE